MIRVNMVMNVQCNNAEEYKKAKQKLITTGMTVISDRPAIFSFSATIDKEYSEV